MASGLVRNWDDNRITIAASEGQEGAQCSLISTRYQLIENKITCRIGRRIVSIAAEGGPGIDDAVRKVSEKYAVGSVIAYRTTKEFDPVHSRVIPLYVQQPVVI